MMCLPLTFFGKCTAQNVVLSEKAVINYVQMIDYYEHIDRLGDGSYLLHLLAHRKLITGTSAKAWITGRRLGSVRQNLESKPVQMLFITWPRNWRLVPTGRRWFSVKHQTFSDRRPAFFLQYLHLLYVFVWKSDDFEDLALVFVHFVDWIVHARVSYQTFSACCLFGLHLSTISCFVSVHVKC